MVLLKSAPTIRIIREYKNKYLKYLPIFMLSSTTQRRRIEYIELIV